MGFRSGLREQTGREVPSSHHAPERRLDSRHLAAASPPVGDRGRDCLLRLRPAVEPQERGATSSFSRDRDLSPVFRRNSARAPPGPHCPVTSDRRGTGHYRPVARSSEPLELGDAEQLDDIDLGLYKLTGSDYGFGVRTTEERRECDGAFCLGLERLAGRLPGGWNGHPSHPVHAVVERSACHGNRPITTCPPPPDVGRHHPRPDSRSTTRTGGMFDWKKSKGKKTALFKWNGKRYELQGKNPLTDQRHCSARAGECF